MLHVIFGSFSFCHLAAEHGIEQKAFHFYYHLLNFILTFEV